eukprot:COSAG04_NODE_6143_length_1398_cov_11.665331_2_plen_117_part_01
MRKLYVAAYNFAIFHRLQHVEFMRLQMNRFVEEWELKFVPPVDSTNKPDRELVHIVIHKRSIIGEVVSTGLFLCIFCSSKLAPAVFDGRHGDAAFPQSKLLPQRGILLAQDLTALFG